MKRLFSTEPNYAFSGAPNSNFRSFSNFRNQNNAPRNVNSSSGGKAPKDVQEPKIRDVGEVRQGTRKNWRSLEATEQRKIRDNFFEDKVKNGDWNKPEHTIGGRKAWQNADHKNVYYTRDNRHNDIEAWQVSGHRAEHLGSMEPVEGTMYKGPNHPPARFE